MSEEEILEAASRLGKITIRWWLPHRYDMVGIRCTHRQLETLFAAKKLDRETYRTLDGVETIYFLPSLSTAPMPSYAICKEEYPR